MKSLTGYIIGGLITFVLILAFQTWRQDKRITELSSENTRLENNLLEIINDRDAQTSLVLTYKEWLRVKDDSISKLLRTLQIKPKQVIKYVEQKITVTDTVVKEVFVEPLSDVLWFLSDTGKCWLWEANAMLDGFDLNIERTYFNFENRTEDIYYWQRRKILFFRIGKKEYLHKTIPRCGEVTERSIEIIKK